MLGFFTNVLEVEAVEERKNKKTGQLINWAKLRIEGDVIDIRIRPGVSVPVGWSGKASGTLVPSLLKSEFNGRLSDVKACRFAWLEEFIPGEEVKKSGSALQNFLGMTKDQQQFKK